LENIPASQLAQEILDSCLAYRTWPGKTLDALIDRALDEDDPFVATAATRAFFGIVVERLGDLFEPELCEVYSRLFSYVIARALPEYNVEELQTRYRRIRQVRRFPGGEVRRVFVLSRVTLGADVAVTSVVLAAAKQRFPDAEIVFVGPPKNGELFAADPRVSALPVIYGRSSLLRERLSAAAELQSLVDEFSSLVIDPDSRLTQLGLIPVCDDARYYFFESRAFGGELEVSLPQLTSEWLDEIFETGDVEPYVAPPRQKRIADVTISLGVGDNDSKRLGVAFEQSVVSTLLRNGNSVLIDCGAGGEEAARVNAIVEGLASPPTLFVHEGSYASFASHIAQSRFYVGYDSAGQHVASACKVPLVSIFTGYACDRTFSRWRPSGPTAQVVKITENDRSTALERTLAAIEAVEGAVV
jgi:ADP-heptose:LPS heptosyltransferase